MNVSWLLIPAAHLANSVEYPRSVPAQGADSARVAVALVESSDECGTNVTGVLGVSEYFRIGGTVEAAPAELAFAPIRLKPLEPAGLHELEWTRRVDGGEASAGIYFVRFKAEGRDFRRRLVWL